MMDYATLRKEGLRQLERLAGGQWTDFNAHDPGITLLEQLCYALTDLVYRTGHDIPDLLASGGADPYASLHAPGEILTCRPVTPDDLRRIIIDVDGVNNAWIELVDHEERLQLYYHPDKDELSLLAAPPPSEPLKLLGLYRVLIEASEGMTGNLVANVARRLHANRGLCEDFAEITVLEAQLIKVDAEVEIGLVDDPAALALDVEQRIADVISPPVPFATLEEMRRAGLSWDEIWNGPRLEHGFIKDESLQSAPRSTAVNTSDLIHAIMDAPSVRAVRSLRISTGDRQGEPWSLAIEANRVARLDRSTSKITFTRDGKAISCTRLPPPGARAAASPGSNEPPRPPGRDRHVETYWSVQTHLPALYGVGEIGLVSSATPERRAQAKQLKAYLLFFDQIMANYLAQLAGVKELFAYDSPEARTYFTQAVNQPGLGLEALRIPAEEQRALSDLEDGAASKERKGRFLNHLLARFAEAIGDHGFFGEGAFTQSRQAMLRQYPRLSSGRGTGTNYLASPGPANRSALEDRLRLRLGLQESQGETFLLIEHILLRPMEGDDEQQIPLLAAPLMEDPYSLQLTFVFPYGAGRFPPDDTKHDYRDLIEQTIREETPAHLTPYVLWTSAQAFNALRDAHEQWLQRRRGYFAERLNVNLEELGS